MVIGRRVIVEVWRVTTGTLPAPSTWEGTRQCESRYLGGGSLIGAGTSPARRCAQGSASAETGSDMAEGRALDWLQSRAGGSTLREALEARCFGASPTLFAEPARRRAPSCSVVNAPQHMPPLDLCRSSGVDASAIRHIAVADVGDSDLIGDRLSPPLHRCGGGGDGGCPSSSKQLEISSISIWLLRNATSANASVVCSGGDFRGRMFNSAAFVCFVRLGTWCVCPPGT